MPQNASDEGLDCSPLSQSLVVQSVVSLTSSLMTKSLTVVVKVFSNTLIYLLQKCE